MKLNYKKLDQFIKEVSIKNKDLDVELLLGVSITKRFIPSIANTIGTDMSKYKVVKRDQFAYGPVTSRNGEKISIALLTEDECLVSTSYTVFEIVDKEKLDPEYLMMWFRRSEFDRYARYMSHGTVREIFGWEEICGIELPIPCIEKQREIVYEYNVVNNRIILNEQLTKKLEDTAQAIYKHWFLDFEFPISEEYAKSISRPELKGQPYKSSGGQIKYCAELEKEIPIEWNVGNLSDIANLIDGDRGKNYPSKEDMSSNGYCLFLNTGNVTKTGFLFEDISFIDAGRDSLLRKGKLDRNDVVITTRGTIGNVARYSKVIPYTNLRINSGMLIVRAKESIYTDFIFSMLKSSHMKKTIESFMSGSAQQQLPIKDIVRINIVLPHESVVIGSRVIFELLYDKIDTLKISQNKLKKLSEIILQRLSKA